MKHFNFYILNSIFKKLLLILVVSCLSVSCSSTTTKVSNCNNTFESAIGSLIKYETNSKISLRYGNHSSLKEVYRVYYSEITSLPKKDRALFFFIVDNNMTVTRGSDLFDYYDLVYSCCETEYITLIKQNIDNPYFDTDVLKNKLGVIETSGARIKESASYQGKSENEYLKELEAFYLSKE